MFGICRRRLRQQGRWKDIATGETHNVWSCDCIVVFKDSEVRDVVDIRSA